ncbi:MAG TPA: TetR/AcrR family transcriptional regulator [Alphaproteobacteria bacterium]|nr:TetR/AcrR family transcriptional regulator [Alphaproteobacteria bacterium]
MNSRSDTKKQILNTAESLLLDLGYNGFSYKDISGAIGIRNASIHYYFPKKSDLGVAIIMRAKSRFEKWALAMDAEVVPYMEKLYKYSLMYKRYVDNGKQICLGGTLETDFKTLPDDMQRETCVLISTMVSWLGNLLEEGRNEGAFQFPGTAKDQAHLIMAGLQGAVQIARVTTPDRFDATLQQILRSVSP